MFRRCLQKLPTLRSVLCNVYGSLCLFSILLMWNQPPDNIINSDSPEAWPSQPEGPERAEKIPKFLRGQIARFKVVHDLQSANHKSLPDLGDLTAEEDAQLLRHRLKGSRGASEPTLLVANKSLRRQESIQKYLRVRLNEDRHGRPRQDSLCPSSSSSLLRPSLPWRSGSLPSLHAIQITSSPTVLIRSTSNLFLNGFSVTLEELEEMFQVGRCLLKSPREKFRTLSCSHCTDGHHTCFRP